MLKPLLLALFFCATSQPLALAQAWTDTSGDLLDYRKNCKCHSSSSTGSTVGNTTYQTGSDAALQAGRGYALENPGRSNFGGWNVQGESGRTTNNRVNLPPTVTAMPIIKDGVNTGLTGGSLALRTQYGVAGDALMELPKTGTDSFAWQAVKVGRGKIYDDEGTFGPPPVNGFTPDYYIERGITSKGLSTGMKSDAPSAWGTPLKYNSLGGVIQGE